MTTAMKQNFKNILNSVHLLVQKINQKYCNLFGNTGTAFVKEELDVLSSDTNSELIQGRANQNAVECDSTVIMNHES